MVTRHGTWTWDRVEGLMRVNFSTKNIAVKTEIIIVVGYCGRVLGFVVKYPLSLDKEATYAQTCAFADCLVAGIGCRMRREIAESCTDFSADTSANVPAITYVCSRGDYCCPTAHE